MSLGQYYNKALFYPFTIAMLFVVPFSIWCNSDYKSEWITADTAMSMDITFAFIYCLIIACLSAKIFLNKLKPVKTNKLLSFLSWFLLPIGFITSVLIREINYNIQYNGREFNESIIYMMMINLPFIIGLTWNYFKYLKAGQSIAPQ